MAATKKFYYKDDTENRILYGAVKWQVTIPDGCSDNWTKAHYDEDFYNTVRTTPRGVSEIELDGFTEISEIAYNEMFGDIVSTTFIIGGHPVRPT